MLANSKIMAFVATSDPTRALDFYQNSLGLTLLDDHEFALVFDAFGTELRVQKTAGFVAQSHTVFGWAVADFQATLRALAENDVQFERFEWIEQDDFGAWQSPSGPRIVWFKDPDGNLLSLTEQVSQ